MRMYYYSKDFQRLYLLPMFCNATNDGDSLYSMFIYTITLFEFGIHFISLAGYIPFIKIVHESRLFHPNLRKFIVFFALLLQLNFPIRTILLFYEFEVVSVTGRLAQDWLLLLPCTLRYFLACVSTLSFFVIINERIAATYFIKDYEQHKRSWIFGIIMFSFLILGTTVCPLIGFCWIVHDWPMFASSMMRYFLLVVSVLFVFNLINERLAATWFVLDYEKRKRTYIFGSMMAQFFVLGTVFSVVGGFLATGDFLYLFIIDIFLPLCFLLVTWQSAGYFYLVNYNTKLLAELSRDIIGKRGYHLSMRYQVAENLRAIKVR
ncbi:unnamed protein product, partial [Mesorhabditis spiculigera]